MRTSVRVAAVAVAAGMCVPTVNAHAGRNDAKAGDGMTIVVAAVIGSNKPMAKAEQWDPDLASLEKQLKRMPFKSYTLLHMKTHDLGAGDLCGVDLPDNRYMQVRIVERTGDSMKLRIILNENNRPIVATDVRLPRNSNVLIAGPRSQEGTLLVSVGRRGGVAAADAASGPVR